MATEIPFNIHNQPSTSSPPSPSTTSFTLTPPSPTDIWRKPPHLDVFTAPIFYKSIPLHRFRRVRVTVSSSWRTLYDQGGLVFILPEQYFTSANDKTRWIKAGIEFFEGRPWVGTVAADRWADWSLADLTEEKGDGEVAVTIEFERHDEAQTLWVYVVKGETRVPVREVTWALYEEQEDGRRGEKEAWVGVYAAKPEPSAEGVEELVVKFADFELELRD